MTALIGDGRPLIVLTALALGFTGGFAIFLSATGSFLPHDMAFLGMTAADLCRWYRCRIVLFMMHDRMAFGGALLAIATLYTWLVLFPLRAQPDSAAPSVFTCPLATTIWFTWRPQSPGRRCSVWDCGLRGRTTARWRGRSRASGEESSQRIVSPDSVTLYALASWTV